MITSICWISKRSNNFKEFKIDELVELAASTSTGNISLSNGKTPSLKNTCASKELNLLEDNEDSTDIYKLYNFDDFSENESISNKNLKKNESYSINSEDETSDTVSNIDPSNISSSDSLDIKNLLQTDKKIDNKEIDYSSDSMNRIHEGDNLIAVSSCLDKVGCIDFFVFNEETRDLFAHHDILVKYEPICLEYVECPYIEEYEGLVAVSFTRPGIDFYDLSVIDMVDPVFTLGSHSLKNRNQDNTSKDHNKAVTCIHWNRLNKNLLASSSADGTSIVWDLTALASIKYDKPRKSKKDYSIEAIKWNSVVNNQYLTLDSANIVQIFDYRVEKHSHLINIRRKIDKYHTNSTEIVNKDFSVGNILWNRHKEHQFITSEEDGYVSIFDIRNLSIITRFEAHNSEVTSMDMCFFDEKYFTTISEDNKLKVWDITMPDIPLKSSISVGESNTPILDIRFSPEYPHLIAVCPLLDTIRVLDLSVVEYQKPKCTKRKRRSFAKFNH